MTDAFDYGSRDCHCHYLTHLEPWAVLAGISGLRGLSGTRIAEGSIGAGAECDDKASTDGDVENAKASLANMVELVTGAYNIGKGKRFQNTATDMSDNRCRSMLTFVCRR